MRLQPVLCRTGKQQGLFGIKFQTIFQLIVLGRLAVDLSTQGLNFGASLLQDAILRVHSIAENTGGRALLVHALHELAKQFYEHYGFISSPVNPMTLMLRL
jgi:predicted GNAT family N-acyltransferase